jgi:hypothetical protein
MLTKLDGYINQKILRKLSAPTLGLVASSERTGRGSGTISLRTPQHCLQDLEPIFYSSLIKDPLLQELARFDRP